MGHFPRYISTSNVVMALTLSSFTCAAVIPQPAYAIEMNDIAAGVRIGKLIEKAKKHFDRGDVRALIEDMLDLKTETENSTGKKLDLEKSIDQVFNDVQKQGVKIDSHTKKEVKKIIKEKGKRYDHKALYMANCMIYDVEYDSQLEEQTYLMNAGIMLAAKAEKDKDRKEDDNDVIIPVKLIVGVTGALAGMFILLIPLPIPGKMNVGTFLVGTGVTYCADALIECVEQKRKKEPHKL